MSRRLLVAGAAITVALALPAAAGAHAQLISAVPADGVTVLDAPTEIRLAFSEPVVAGRSTLDLYGSDGRRFQLESRLTGATLTAAVPHLADGTYRLVWKTLSVDDLHVVGGEVVFGTGAATPAPVAHVVKEPQPRPGEVAIRWLALVLLALLTGSLVLRALGAAALPRLERAAAAGTVVAAGALFAIQLSAAGSLGVVASSGAGRSVLLMATGLGAAVVLAGRRPRAAVVAATAAAGALALGSHAAAFGAVPTLVIGVHLACASLWAGTVLAAAIAVRRGAAAGLLRRLAPVLAPAVAGLAITGLLALGRHVVNVDALLTSTYGRFVLAKTVLLIAAGAMALTTRRALADNRPGSARRAVFGEAVLLMLALGGAAVLAAGAPARGPQFAPPAQATPSVIETRQINDLIVSIEVKPNRPGANFVAIRVLDTRRPALAPVTGVRLTAPGLAAEAKPSGENEWQVAGLQVARAGAIDLRVDVARPGMPATTAVRWTTGGAPATAPPVISRQRLGPLTTPLAVALLALLLAAAVGYRRRTRTAIVLVALLAFPAAALAADDPPESVIVTLRGGGAAVQGFGGTPSERGSAVAGTLRQGLGIRGRALRRALSGRATSIRPLWIAGGYAVTAPRSVVDALRSRSDVERVTADATNIRPAAEYGIDLLAAPAVWSHTGYGVLQGTDGAGITVAVLDTGLDIDGQLATRSRGGPGGWLDAYGTYSSPVDAAGSCSGHGTAVSGVIAGDVDDGGLPYGMAPGADVIAARIFDGGCRATASAIHAAFQWVLDPDGDPDTADAPAVVNASWGEVAVGCPTTFAPDLAALRAAGIVVVFAAGNATDPSSPATLPDALAVGALDAAGTAARPESGHGVSPCDGRTLPDLVAPGTDVRTADRASTWQTVSGTSIAAPHVTGALALLLARHPGLTADEQTNALLSTAYPLAPDTGAGRVDALAAFESALPGLRDTTAPIFPALGVSPALSNGAVPLMLTATATDAVPGAPLAGTVAGVTLAVDGAPAVPVALGPDGAIAATIDAHSLGDGAHAAVLVATDDSGNTSRPRAAAFTIDRVAPTLSALVADRDGAGHVVATTSATDASVITAAESTFGTVSAADGAFDTPHELVVVRGDSSGWGVGAHAIRVRVRDAAGTWSTWRETQIVVPRMLRNDGFEHGLAAWSARGAVRTTRAAALAGRRGLDVRPRGHAVYLEVATPIAERVLDVSFLLRASGLRGTVRVLELLDSTGVPVATIDIRRGRVRAGGRWRALPRGTVRLLMRFGLGRVSLAVNGRSASSVAAPGTVDRIRLGAVHGGRGTLAIDQFRAVRG